MPVDIDCSPDIRSTDHRVTRQRPPSWRANRPLRLDHRGNFGLLRPNIVSELVEEIIDDSGNPALARIDGKIPKWGS